MPDGLGVIMGIFATLVGILFMYLAYTTGKQHMRDEVKTYGCEQAIKAYAPHDRR